MDDDPEIEDEPFAAEVAALDDRLYRHNVAVTGCGDGRRLAIFVRDPHGGLLAGLHGWTWGRTGFVRTLWVREELRGQGIGARLLAAAEREAVRRGCREMQLDTHSYQAPGFYRRCGYEQIGEFPAGRARTQPGCSSGRRSDFRPRGRRRARPPERTGPSKTMASPGAKHDVGGGAG
jgi:GNAT superfamily N-acetyltransferase